MEKLVLKLIIDQFCGRIIITLDFVADHILLVFYLCGGVDTVEYDIRQQVDGFRQMFLEDGSIEDGILFVGKGIQVAPNTLQAVENLQGRALVRPFEGHVFTEMGKSFLPHLLLSGTGSDTDAAVDNWGHGGQVDDT